MADIADMKMSSRRNLIKGVVASGAAVSSPRYLFRASTLQGRQRKTGGPAAGRTPPGVLCGARPRCSRLARRDQVGSRSTRHQLALDRQPERIDPSPGVAHGSVSRWRDLKDATYAGDADGRELSGEIAPPSNRGSPRRSMLYECWTVVVFRPICGW
jgi:hypothetical protein